MNPWQKKMFLIHITSISLRILQADLLLRTTMSLQRVGDLKLAIPSVCLPASPSPHKGHHLWAHKSLGCARCDSSNRRGQGPHTPPLVSLPLSKQGKLRQRGAANIGVVTKCRGCFMSQMHKNISDQDRDILSLMKCSLQPEMIHGRVYFSHAALTLNWGCQRSAITSTHKLN